MTREEAIELNKETCCHMSDELIHAIYNSFESRTCEGCIHLEDIEKSFKHCSELDINIGHLTWGDFYCKYWEKQDGTKR